MLVRHNSDHLSRGSLGSYNARRSRDLLKSFLHYSPQCSPGLEQLSFFALAAILSNPLGAILKLNCRVGKVHVVIQFSSRSTNQIIDTILTKILIGLLS